MLLSNVGSGTLLLLIRHGETQWNADQRIQGNLDVELSERGRDQARHLAFRLREENVDVYYSSDLRRAFETAEILAERRLPVLPEPRLREARFGEWEGMTGAECRERFPEVYAAWRADALRNRPPGGETLESLQERCMEALAELLPRHPSEKVAVVAHGGPVRAMVCGVLGLPLAHYHQLRVENTAVSRLLFRENGPILAGFNDVAHLRASAAMPGHSGWEEK